VVCFIGSDTTNCWDLLGKNVQVLRALGSFCHKDTESKGMKNDLMLK
jgi:hypothetical protein